MIITLLCEPRSGSTNLANWFFNQYKLFTVLFNPDIKPENQPPNNAKYYQNGLHPSQYKYKTPHLIIKEDYYHYKNYGEFVEASDRIICLYRKNENEQIESWINAKHSGNWVNEWVFENKINEKEKFFFKQLKASFKEKYLDTNKFFKISYEELYYENGLIKILNYLKINNLEYTNFPVGKKYRINPDKLKKNLI